MKHTIKGRRAFTNDRLLQFVNSIVTDNSTVLDLGCGPGLYSNPLRSRCQRVVSVDAWDWVEPDIVADLENTALTDIVSDRFDFVLMLDFIEHLDRAAGARLMADAQAQCDGVLILLTPLEQIWTENHENVDNHELWCYGNRYDIHKSLWRSEDFVGFQQHVVPSLEDYFLGTWSASET